MGAKTLTMLLNSCGEFFFHYLSKTAQVRMIGILLMIVIHHSSVGTSTSSRHDHGRSDIDVAVRNPAEFVAVLLAKLKEVVNYSETNDHNIKNVGRMAVHRLLAVLYQFAKVTSNSSICRLFLLEFPDLPVVFVFTLGFPSTSYWQFFKHLKLFNQLFTLL